MCKVSVVTLEFRCVTIMVDQMKIVILITLVIANSIECEAEKSVRYDQYKLVRMFTSGIKDQKTIYDFLTPSK